MMARRGAVLAVGVLALLASACASTAGHSDASSTTQVTRIKHITVSYTKSYDSISALKAATTTAVVATAKSVAPDPSSRPSLPESLVTMKVSKVLRGNPGRSIIVNEAGGQPGDIVNGQVPIEAGQTYLMLLGHDAHTEQYFVLHGTTGLFRYDTKTQQAARLDQSATWIPNTVSLSLVEAILGTSTQPSDHSNATPPIPLPAKPLPPIAGACPPGCRLASDYDAITWLAASSESVTIVTARSGTSQTSGASTDFKVDRALEITGTQWRPEDPIGPFTFPALVNGHQYLVFLSYWRGGPCISTFYAYDSQTQTASLLKADRTEIPLPGRVLPVPRHITLVQLRKRMYPTGPFVQSTDASESMCPE
jgi:hypothetical protein